MNRFHMMMVVVLAGQAFAWAGSTIRVNVSTDGQQANGATDSPAMSADGRYVAFASRASNLVPNDTNGATDVFVHDCQSGTTTRVSVASDGSQLSVANGQVGISADGRYVVFSSISTFTVFGSYVQRIYVHDCVTGETSCVSEDRDMMGHAYSAVISADGRYVGYYLHPGLWVCDRVTGQKENVSWSVTGEVRGGFSLTLSGDGRHACFADGMYTDLVPNDTNMADDVFVFDRVLHQTTRASVASDGSQSNQPNGRATYASISADGRYVAFCADATNLVPGDSNGQTDVFVHDRQLHLTSRVSVSTLGVQGDLPASIYYQPGISADGRFVTFFSYATNLVDRDTNNACDVFIRDRVAGITTRASLATDGSQANSGSGTLAHCPTSADGRYVAFVSGATNLVAGDTNGLWDVFVRDRTNSPPAPPQTCTVDPTDPVCTSALQAAAGGSYDVDGTVPTYKYQWARVTDPPEQVNKRRRGKSLSWGYDSTDGRLAGATLQRGDTWAVHACATDGTADSAWTDPVEVTIQNSTPAVPTSLAIAPANPLCTSTLAATADGGSDADTGDTVGYRYEWSKLGGEGGAGRRGRTRAEWGAWGHGSTDGVLTGVTLVKGDVWRVHACATDGTADSAWMDPVEVTVENSPPPTPTSLAITPDEPRCTSILQAACVAGADADGDPVTLTYEWSKLGGESGAGQRGRTRAEWGAWGHAGTDGVLTGVTLAKGDVWRVHARAGDGTADSPWTDPVEVTVANSPPDGLTVALSPTAPRTLDDLTATPAAADADGDGLTYECQWSSRVGAGDWSAWGNSGLTIDHSLTAKGQQWKAQARAFDGTDYGPWRESSVVRIDNTAPTAPDAVMLSPASPTSIRDLRIAVTGGADADGDSLRYACQYSHRKAGEEWSPWQPCERIISHARTTRGEEWRVRARTNDGTVASPWLGSNTVTIQNAPPPRPDAVAIGPVHPHPHEELIAVATGGPDPDGDSITYVYRWRRSLDGGAHWSRWSWRGQTLSKLLVAPGSQWQAEARASDGMEEGPWRLSVPVTADGGAPPQRGVALAAVTVAAAPTAGGVQIVTTLSAPAAVQASICNMAGRPVALLPERNLPEGTSTLLWDGRSSSGTQVPAGAYLVRVTARTEDGQQSQALAAVRLQ